MRECLPRHVCVIPEHAGTLTDAFAAVRLRRPAVLWLDDLERYLGPGGLTRANIVELLDTAQIVVLATMRAHERDDLSARHDPNRERGDLQVARASRDVLSLASEIRLERRWSPKELASAGNMSSDPRIAHALASAEKYGLAELMAAGPQLLGELRDAWSVSSRDYPSGRAFGDPRGAALVAAAVDVRLAGYHKPVPLTVLRDLHEVYLAANGGAALRAGSWENALAWATQPLYATSSLLEPAENESYLAFDYLVDSAARNPATPPIPNETWTTLIENVELDDAVEVAWQASFAGWIAHPLRVFDRALTSEQYVLAAEMARCVGNAGQERQAVALLELTIERAKQSGTTSPEDVLAMRDDLAWELGEKVGGQGDPKRALKIAREVAADSATLLGPAHPQTFGSQLTLARQLGATSASADALALAREVSARAADALGADHRIVDSARFEVAARTRHVEGDEAAARLFGNLPQDLSARCPANLSLQIDCAWNLGGCLLATGNAYAALPVLEAAMNDSRKVYGEMHARTLTKKMTYLDAVAATTGPSTAIELGRQLVDDSSRALGDDHLTTLQTRRRTASWTAEVGDAAAAVQMFTELQCDAEQALPENHWLIVGIRTELANLGDS
jgi:hypothetical protein